MYTFSKNRSLFKRLVIFVMALVMVFSMSAMTYAADNNLTTDVTESADNQIQPRIDFVATMRIFSTTTVDPLKSHAWIQIVNTSSQNITVGRLQVAPNDSVTLGTYGNRPAHTGLWYNIESYAVNNSGSKDYTWMRSNIVKTTALTSTELLAVNSKINSSDSWTTLANNCSNFALKVWNAGPGTKLNVSGYPTPYGLANAMKAAGNYESGKNSYMPYKSASQIYRQTSGGIVQDSSGAIGTGSSGL